MAFVCILVLVDGGSEENKENEDVDGEEDGAEDDEDIGEEDDEEDNDNQLGRSGKVNCS